MLPVNELVFYGVGEEHAPLKSGGVHLEAPEYHKKITEPDTVVIDVRNAYESDIGKFAGALDPQMRKSTDFPTWLRKPVTTLSHPSPPSPSL